MYRTIEITKITGQDEKSAKSEEPKTMVCTLYFFALLFMHLCKYAVSLQYLAKQIYFFPCLFYIQMDQFLSGYNVQQTVANSKQSPSLIQTSVPSSAANKEAESKPAASKV